MPDTNDDHNGTQCDVNTIEDVAQDWLILVRSKEVTQKQLAEFQCWYDADSQHRAAYDEQNAIWDDLGGLHEEFTQFEDVSAIEQKTSTTSAEPAATFPIAKPRNKTKKVVWYGSSFAACLALLALFFGDINVWLTADYRTGTGEHRSVRLTDGSMIHLNTDTAIAVRYRENQRYIELIRGEAFFEVRTDPARPFEVHALEGSATAIGTSYAVREHNNHVNVIVTEGRVRVSSLTPNSIKPSEASVLVEVGQSAHYYNGRAPELISQRNLAQSLAHSIAWLDRKLIIADQPLRDALQEVDRYRPGKILLLADNADQRINARLSLDAIDSGLKALAATHDLDVTYLTEYLVVIR